MKRTWIRYLVAIGLLATASLVQAQSVTFNLTASITGTTCSFTVNDVDLGTYAASSFTGSTTTPWSSAITVQKVSCSVGNDSIRMTFQGTPDPVDSRYFAAMSTSGNVTGVAIELQDLTLPMGPLRGTPSAHSVAPGSTVRWNSTGNTHSLNARFTQTLGSVTPGTVKTPITIQFTYN